MSWSNLLGNQTVSRANIQDAIDTGVFVQRNGVPGTESNRQITKANAIDYIYAWELYSPLQSKASNQLVVKSNLAVQSMQFFATNDGGNAYLYVGNNNRSWVYLVWSTNAYNAVNIYIRLYGQDLNQNMMHLLFDKILQIVILLQSTTRILQYIRFNDDFNIAA